MSKLNASEMEFEYDVLLDRAMFAPGMVRIE